MIRDQLWVIRDMRTGRRLGAGAFLDRESAELALDVAIKRAERKGDAAALRGFKWCFVDEYLEVLP